MMSYVGTSFQLIAIAVSSSLVLVLGLCLCGCRKQRQKNDFLGLTGMVKITNPDEVLNQDTLLQSAPANTAQTEDQSKRLKINANPHRSLPDIPICSDSNTQHSASEVPEVVAELYATVGGKVFTDPGSTTRPEVQSGSNRLSAIHDVLDGRQDDETSSYTTFLNFDHTYNRVQVSEHPYAQVQNSRAKDTTANLSNAHLSTQNNNNDVMQNHNGVDDHVSADIPAAPAIAGRVSANQELPYMTPPIQNNHFSGDSQDSSKGYTSISVREPLVNILVHANQNTSRTNQELIDSHYTTVSDDSDEMYAAIEEQPFSQSDVYTSVSETYAQIQFPAESNVVNNQQPTHIPYPSNSNAEVSINNNLPEVNDVPGSISSTSNNMQQVLQVHTRQDSSSSCVSSVGNVESPKPMKRQANSPLPLPPSNPMNIILNNQINDNKIDYDHDQNPESNTLCLTETDMLVNGNINSKDNPDIKMQNLKSLNLLLQADESEITGPITDLEGMYAKVIKKHKMKSDEKLNTINNKTDFKNYETVDKVMSNQNNDCSLNLLPQIILNENISNEKKSFKTSKTNEEKDPGYETICDNSVYKGNSIPDILHFGSQGKFLENCENAPNIRSSSSDSDPNYEELNLPEHAKSGGYSTVPELTSINNSNKQIESAIKSASENNYETVKQCNSTNYDSIKRLPKNTNISNAYQSEKSEHSKKVYSDPVDDYFQV